MTDNEIKKALECCVGDNDGKNCFDCPLWEIDDCQEQLLLDALDIINRPQAKVIKEQNKNSKLRNERNRLQAEVERLKDILYDADGVNLVNYWHQQCKIAENGCRNFDEENKNLKAENERLIEECGNQSMLWCKHFESIFETAKETIKAEAIKEFAERLKEKAKVNEWNGTICGNDIENLLKEMVGDN